MNTRDKLEAMKQTEERNRQHEQEWRERQNMKTVIQWTEGEQATVETNAPDRIRQLKTMCEKYPQFYQIVNEDAHGLYIKCVMPVHVAWGTIDTFTKTPQD